MRLQLALLTSTALLLLSGRGRTDGDITTRMSSEVSSYNDTQHVTAVTPTIAGTVARPSAGWSVDGRYLADIISAASVDIVSTASPRWTELRHAATLGGRYKPRDFGQSISGSFSREPDYLSLSLAGGVEHDFLAKAVTLSLGYAYGHDTIGRSGTPFDVFSRTLVKHAFKPSAVFVLDRSSVLTLVGDVILERGDGSKPYRYIPMFTASSADKIPAGASIDLVNSLRLPERPLEQLPLARDRFAVTARYAHRADTVTLRLEERLYTDSWGMWASTTDFRPIFDVGSRVSLWTHLRLHAQRAVSFWKRAYVIDENGSIPALRTGDRELGTLASVTAGGGFRWALGHTRPDSWVLSTQLDGTYTTFFDTLYVKRRLAGFLAIALEVEL